MVNVFNIFNEKTTDMNEQNTMKTCIYPRKYIMKVFLVEVRINFVLYLFRFS